MRRKFSYPAVCLLLFLMASCSLPIGAATEPGQAVLSTPAAESPATEPAAGQPSQTSEAAQPAVPAWTPAVETPRRYAVILVEKNDALNIRTGAGAGYDIAGHFTADEKDVQTTGKAALADGQAWLEAENPAGGTGWVNARYLTEYVSEQDFCDDGRVNALLDKLKQAINDEDGDLLKTLVSPAHGLELYYWRGGNTANYTQEEAAWVFKSTYKVNWGSGPSGMDDIGTFSEFPLPALKEVLNDKNLELKCSDASSASMYAEPWPQMYANIRYYALYKPGSPNVDLDWGTWLAGVEYVNGEPYLFALIRFVWEP